MSLVEKALKKLQDAHPAQDNPGATPIRRVEPALEASDVSTVTVPKSNKRVTLNRTALRIAGLLAPEAGERRLATEYRHVKRPLIAAALGKGVPQLANGRMIMVASALPGEGKTFTSVNLALSMALEKDIHVLLADADVAKPHISRSFGIEDEPGLLDVLRDESREIESVILSTDAPGLSLLPAGRQSEGATELLASSRMEQVVAKLASSDPQRIVLFDSPPLLLTTESRVLAGVVGQVVIVVRAESTLRQAVHEALECVADGRFVGLILNQSESAPPNVYYGYGDYGNEPQTQS